MKYVGNVRKSAALDQIDPTIFRQIHHLSTGQSTLYLLNNLIPNRLCLKSGPLWKVGTLHWQRGHVTFRITRQNCPHQKNDPLDPISIQLN